MSELSTLRPTQALRLMDLVREAGVDVTDWAKCARGAAGAAANPKYCYEWAFVEPGRLVVLNVWHGNMVEREGGILIEDNLRELADRHAREPDGRGPVWRRRAERFDAAIRTAAAEGLPIRAVVLDGERRLRTEEQRDRVTARLLDPVSWGVAAYDAATGAFTLARCATRGRAVDQFTIGAGDDSPTETRAANGTVFVRSPAVRRAALTRSGGRCEWCGEPGFVTAAGEVFLETHHVVPLSEGGRDAAENVVALCPNHHREAHHGAARGQMRARLLQVAPAANRTGSAFTAA